ncbi:hypothetical protein niasHS_016445 [Heterodera schachtii]|uniref:Uncharacterized protein n=1 Tax=Heterodera schachtii TaxID=97005 RepID=A0ABD2HNP4_HETSC
MTLLSGMPHGALQARTTWCADDEKKFLCIDIVQGPSTPYVMKTTPYRVAFCSFGFWRTTKQSVLCHFSATSTKVRSLHIFPLCGVCDCPSDKQKTRPWVPTWGRHKRSCVCAYTHVELNVKHCHPRLRRHRPLLRCGTTPEWDGQHYSVANGQAASSGLKVQAERMAGRDGGHRRRQRQAFVAEFLHTEGIHLDPTKVAFNPGLRLIAKTLANSLCGKLSQRVGHTEIQYTRTPAEFHKLLDDPTYDKLDFVHVSDHMDRWPIFVTSYARLHLYGYMEQVLALNNAELLYCDWSSVCTGGEALGQMKREHVDRRIVEFVAGGPKNYGIRHTARDGTDERANLKIRSFRLSYATPQLINFDAMKEADAVDVQH